MENTNTLELEALETVVKEGIKSIRATKNKVIKEEEMQRIGDIRWEQYKICKDERYKRLAGNCYFAARNFHNKIE